jgi:hypothetical protein
VFDKSNRTDGTFSRSEFVFDAERNHYTCPQGKLLVLVPANLRDAALGHPKMGRGYTDRSSLIARTAP